MKIRTGRYAGRTATLVDLTPDGLLVRVSRVGVVLVGPPSVLLTPAEVPRVRALLADPDAAEFGARFELTGDGRMHRRREVAR